MIIDSTDPSPLLQKAMATRKKYEINPPAAKDANEQSSEKKVTPQEVFEKYSGRGKSYKVKFIGAENIAKGSVAATILNNLRTNKHITEKVKVVLTLGLKGLTLFEESSTNSTCVKLTKVKHVCRDPDDVTFFGITIATTESPTRYRMYAFKAEKSIAADFVMSAREVVTFVQSMMVSKRKEEVSGEEETDAPDEKTGFEAPSLSLSEQAYPDEMTDEQKLEHMLQKIGAELDEILKWIFDELQLDMDSDENLDSLLEWPKQQHQHEETGAS